MEKRLGIAQLCIMVAVLVFMALTRGSRGESTDHVFLPRLPRRTGTMSLNGEWMRQFRTGSNPIQPTQSLDGSAVRAKGTISYAVVPVVSQLLTSTRNSVER